MNKRTLLAHVTSDTVPSHSIPQFFYNNEKSLHTMLKYDKRNLNLLMSQPHTFQKKLLVNKLET